LFYDIKMKIVIWGISSVGRARCLQLEK
jgi:hypothetical protein